MTIAALIAFVASWLPTLAVGAGPVGLLLGLLPKLAPSWKTFAYIGAAVMAVTAISGATVHYLRLRSDSAALHTVTPKIAALEESLGCPGRPPAERELFACIPARDRDIEAARVAALSEQQKASARALDTLQRQTDQLAASLAESDALIDAAADVDDGPVPKVMLDAWTRERKARGTK